MASTIDQLQVIISASTDEFERKLNGLTASGGPLARFGIAVGATMAAAGTAVVGFGAKAISVGTTFEQSMSEVFRNIGGVSEEMEDELTTGVRNIATQYGVSAVEIAGALAEYAYSGLETADALESVELATKGAIATGSDLSTVIVRLDGITAAFRGQGYETAEVMDILTALSSNATGGFDNLSASLVKVAPSAVMAGVSLEEAGAAIGALTWMGVPAAEAGTQVRTMFDELGNAGSRVGKRFKELTGQTFPEFMAAGGTLEEGLAILSGGLEENETIAQLFGSTLAGNAAATIAAGEGAVYYGDVLDSLQGSAGALEEAHQRMSSTVQSQLQLMQAHIQDLFLTASEHLLPIFGEVLAAVQSSMPQVKEIVNDVFGTVVEIIRWVVDELFPQLQAGFHGTAESSSVLTTIGEYGRFLFDTLQDVFEGIGVFLSDFISILEAMGIDTEKVWETIKSAFNAGRDGIEAVFAIIAALWESVLKPTFEVMAPFIGAAINSIVDILNGFYEVVSGVFGFIAAALQGDWSTAWSELSSAVTAVFESIIPAIVSFGENFINLLITPIRAGIEKMSEVGAEIVNGLISGITGKLEDAKEAISNFGGNIVGWFKNTLGIQSPSRVMMEQAGFIVDGIAQGLEKNYPTAEAAAKGLAETIRKALDATRNWTSTLLIQLEYGLKTPEEILEELEAVRVSLLEQLIALDEAGEAGTEAYAGVAQQLSTVEGAIGQVNREIEETGKAAEQAAEQARRAEDARIQHLRSTGQMSLEDYKAILEERLAALVANNEGETEAAYKLRTEIHRVQQDITNDYESELAERQRLSEQHSNAQRRLADNRLTFLRETGAIDIETYIGVLEQKMSQEEKFSDAWMSLWREVNRLRNQEAQKQADEEARIRAEAQAAEEAAAREAAAEEERRRKAEADAARAHADRLLEINRNRYEEARRLGIISDEQHLASLRSQLAAIEDAGNKYTAEWAAVNDEIISIERQRESEAQALLDEETRARQDAADARRNYQRQIGQLTLKDEIQLIDDRLAELAAANQTESAEYYNLLTQKDRYQQEFNQKQKDYEQSLYEFRRYTGQVTLQEHISNLQAQLTQESLTKEERLALERELFDATQQLRDESRAAEERLVQHKLKLGEMSTEQYLDYLRQQLESEEITADERMAILEEVHTIEQRQLAERESLNDRLYDFLRKKGDISLQEHISNLEAKLENEELSAAERLDIEVQLFDATKELRDKQAAEEERNLKERKEKHEKFLNDIFKGIDAFRGILGKLGLDGDSAWGKLLDGGIKFAKAITSGDWIGAISAAIETVINLLGDMGNGFKEGLKVIEDAQKRLRWANAESFGEWTTVNRGGILGWLGFKKAAFEIDQFALDMAVALENGVARGLTRGMKSFLSGESTNILAAIASDIRSTIEDAVIEAAMTSAAITTRLGPIIEGLTKSITEGDGDSFERWSEKLRVQLPKVVNDLRRNLEPIKEILDDVFKPMTDPQPRSPGVTYTPLDNGGSGYTQTINVLLDGRTLATAVGQNLPSVLTLNGVGY